MTEPARPATDEDFNKFLGFCDSSEGWTSVVDKPELKVWEMKSNTSSINIVKVFAIFPNVSALELYDTLHDPDYRPVWDENMIEGYNIEPLDPNNDVGYYSAKAPPGVTNRDFCNERSWRVRGQEYIIMNHTVPHPKCPEKPGFVRARSIMTGYVVRARPEGGCIMIYLSQTDPKGWIPAFVINSLTKKFVPKIIEKLEKAAMNYTQWKSKHNPDDKPWRAGGGNENDPNYKPPAAAPAPAATTTTSS